MVFEMGGLDYGRGNDGGSDRDVCGVILSMGISVFAAKHPSAAPASSAVFLINAGNPTAEGVEEAEEKRDC